MSAAQPSAVIVDPRPPSAWVLVGVASACLWITGELAAWVMPVQLVCYAVSYWTRHEPPAWRQSAVWLNVGMFAITSVTISRALDGSPAPLSLAYFAALTQGLQLIDARPRKSEFLLVALALFQVILAANLTDSVFYPPLLLVFLVATTWTLLVHTLRVEAAEAGDTRAARTVITPGLIRTTLVAVCVSIALALMLFMLLPRMRSSMFSGGMAANIAVSGFSDHISLGSIGQIRRDPRVVLRVETLDGAAPRPEHAYWRGLAFDRFDGRSWSISDHPARLPRQHVSGSPRFGVELGGGPTPDARVERIVREPVEAGVLFAAGPIRRLEGPLSHLSRDENGGLYFPSKPDTRIRYTVWSERMKRDEDALARDHSVAPRETGPLAEARAARWTALPELPEEIAMLAGRITSGLVDDAARLRAIERYLRREGRYTDDPPDLGLEADRSPVADFLLGELAGHCEYFASGMVVLSRTLGMPARLVNGFAGGRINRIGGFTEVTRADAHAWVEVHFAGAGWVRYDPTPPDLRMRGLVPLSLAERFTELASVIELWWFQRVVDFDSSDQILALKSVWAFAQSLLARLEPERGEGAVARAASRTRSVSQGSTSALRDAVPVEALLLLLASPLLVWLGLRWRSKESAKSRVRLDYRDALRMLARKDLPREPATTARDFADQVATRFGNDVTEPFARITEAYLRDRFGASQTNHSERQAGSEVRARSADLAHMRSGLRRARG